MRYLILAAIALAGCTTAQTASVTATINKNIPTAQADLTKAIGFVQTAEGLANVAAIAVPGMAADLTAVEAIINPLLSTAQAALADATQTAPQLEQLATQLTTQAASLAQTAAPAIKAVPAS